MLRLSLLLLGVLQTSAMAETLAVDIYSNEQLLQLMRDGTYLQRVKADDCQLVQDIEARAEVLKQPLYQFLWGEMLNQGVCVKQHASRGMAMLRTSAEQGSAEAMIKLADYHYQGKLVVKDKDKSVQYVLPAAANGSLAAQIMLVRLFSEGYGSPTDYELGYHLLYNNVFEDEATQKRALSLLRALAAKMPTSVVERAQKSRFYTR
ncbi:tetratricopeptide repeat protein [Shewanella sp. SR44-3]|uniref:tetratricopeptide repeat protein n=1 Tax=unclassified Shewanella TaxID=196818 RepID=UPI0015F9C202|nr:sel1 repeat family protein [Shewanella sp. SR44-3]MBB1269721.1 sel1 repeat family protein [Shewanella sp. SR44-3]